MLTKTHFTRFVAKCDLPTAFGCFKAFAFERSVPESASLECLALVRGDVRDKERVLVRIHSECLTGDALGSLRCDCGDQLEIAMHALADSREGVLVYVKGHEGRGVGLLNKIRAYALQDKGADTVDANIRLGFEVDARTYDIAVDALRFLGIRSVKLMTNNPMKVEALTNAGVSVDERVGVSTATQQHNARYLDAKRTRMGHLFD
ncbi:MULTISPECIES: GTP cyclohydrolase II [unclassified Burkholderia]|uniref:GTP cyclohydrolase II n=1 Tax=unclassified Burkholderia TaxID=2613784 RepID=UPI000F57B729|nr:MULTISPECIES: GTP cyclohydrolase II [unclassified Burkholderia]RQS26819.1 GTP cyclohydrolase II [Burkholderia sp. Bp8995]RQS51705.1 GTP cyclohydrolase II [Burkholderia sp. Bp8989]